MKTYEPSGQGVSVSDPDTTTTSMDLGSLPGTAVGVGLGMAGVPGAGLVGAGVNALSSGKSFSDIQDGLLSSLASTVVSTALPGIPGLPSMAGALAGEAVKDDSNFSAAATKSGLTTAGAMIGSAVAGPFGGLLGGALAGYAAKSSLEDGWLGDITDARSHESKRDAIEDAFGFDPSDTAGMVSTQAGMNAFGVKDKGFGMEAAYGSTTAGQLSSSAAETGLFDDTSLMGYLDQLDELATEFDDIGTGASKSSPTGWGNDPNKDDGGWGHGKGDDDASAGVGHGQW